MDVMGTRFGQYEFGIRRDVGELFLHVVPQPLRFRGIVILLSRRDHDDGESQSHVRLLQLLQTLYEHLIVPFTYELLLIRLLKIG